MMDFRSVISIVFVGILLSGCTQVIALGYEKPYCEENGIDYTDAGICGNPMDIYKNRKSLSDAVVNCKGNQ